MGLNAKLKFIDHSVPELEGADVSIIRVELWQAISELFTLTIQLRARASHIEMRDVVGQMAEVSFFKDEVQSEPEPFLPRVRGLVRRGRQQSLEATGTSTYELVIVPPHWVTSLRTASHIFHQSTAPEIVSVLIKKYADAGIATMTAPIPPTAPTRKREYTVQYAESDLHCIQRVLAEDGIAFVFAGDGLEELRLTHDTRASGSDVHAELPVLPSGSAIHGDAEAIVSLSFGPALRPGKQHLRDYNFDNPFFHPTGDFQDGDAFELVELVGGRAYEEGVLHEARDGEAELMSDLDRSSRAQVRLEGERRDHKTLTAELTSPLPAGARLTITGDHPAAAHPQLVVRSVSVLEYSGDAGTAKVTRSHRVDCIPQSYPYRPPRLPKPKIHGLQRGSVGGNEEIDVDEHGRVYVVFQWDDRERFRKWKGPPDPVAPLMRRVSVAQDWAGSNRGFLTLPRLGDEVIVAYIDGDPDEPIIVGRLYNGRNRTAINLPEDRTQSVWRSCSSPNGDGFHEIRFEDKVGSEELHIEAERLHTRLVKGEEQIDVGGNRTIHVGGSQNEKIDVSLFTKAAGLITEEAGARHKIDAPITVVESLSRREQTGGRHLIKSGVTSIDSGAVFVSASTISLSVGGSVITLSKGKILIKSAVVEINP